MKTVCAFAPATIANLNVGFDTLGLSLSSIGDKVEVTENQLFENRITEIANHSSLPTDVHKNCCTVVIAKMQEEIKDSPFVDVRIKKGFASGSGLGSSSASSAAAAFAYNGLLNDPFKEEELLQFAAEGERIACGAPHLDNVAPALLGGIILLHQNKAIRLPLPETFYSVSFFPDIEINTSSARSIVPQATSLRTTTIQVSNMGAFVSALYESNYELMKSSLKDLLVEPTRKILIPYFDEMREQSLKSGAITFGISGSGPSVFALAQSNEIAEEVRQELERIYEGKGIKTLSFIEDLTKKSGASYCNYND